MHMNKDGTLNVEGDLREAIKKLEQRIAELEAKLVQRDVYEAEQRLPPEHAVLIKHLATVERCIAEGPVTYHYAEDSDCSFCGEWQGHTRDCAWFALQMDRGVTSVIDDIHAVALQEHERRERQRTPLAGHSHRHNPTTLEQMNNIFREMYGPMVRPMTAAERGAEIHREIQEALERQLSRPVNFGNLVFGNMRVDVNSLVPPGTVLITNLANDTHVVAPVAPNLGIGGEEPPSAVAPPDDEDVP